jgi:hypothetical protein
MCLIPDGRINCKRVSKKILNLTIHTVSVIYKA